MEIIKEFNTERNYWTVKCEKGHKLTTWKEGDPIEEYSSFTVAYCPKDADLTQFRCVTIEEDTKLTEQARKAIEK